MVFAGVAKKAMLEVIKVVPHFLGSKLTLQLL